MCDQISLHLPADRRSPAAARRFVEQQCALRGLAPLSDRLVLPVSELVTNAVLHARTGSVVTFTVAAGFLEVAVSDGSFLRPVPRPMRADLLADLDWANRDSVGLPADPRHPALHVGVAGSVLAGRGLQIVAGVADEWGVAGHENGKTVWFRMRPPPGWRPERPCPCSIADTASPGGRAWARSADRHSG